MQITRLKLKNWRNFRHLDIPLSNRTYVIGANASGKSNLLDVFRFLRDVSKPSGGGLQKAVADRDGITKLRCLQARKDTEVRIDLTLAPEPGAAARPGVRARGSHAVGGSLPRRHHAQEEPGTALRGGGGAAGEPATLGGLTR